MAKRTRAGASVQTLAVDIGGTGIKTMVLDERGEPLGERLRVPTPRPATPEAMLPLIGELAVQGVRYDRVSVGFPGVVRKGVTHNAPNLDPTWNGFELADALTRLLGKPVRVANDADVQGLGAIEGHGVEVVITLGTGMGSALFVDGRLVPNMEAGHHPFRGGKTYEEMLGKQALDKAGKKKWNKRLERAIRQLEHLFNYDALYIGGGNAKKIVLELPDNVRIVKNVAGLLGGIALWRDARA